MFWKKRKSNIIEQNKDTETENTLSVCTTTVFKRELKHTKSIINGKLYDIEKSTQICPTKDHRLLFVTQKGNYFSCATENDNYIQPAENAIHQVLEIKFFDIRPETEQYARENIGMYDVEKYIELFGEVEEA
ncbi:MAG: hypothetical protein NC548_45470 [Lachnospiraceae bacterium]|nr:hypothetical protein [Lachnospiraceae bacterium]